MKIYVAIVFFGKFDQEDQENIYVGADYDKAVEKIKNREYFDNHTLCKLYDPIIDTWLNGVKVNSEIIKD